MQIDGRLSALREISHMTFTRILNQIPGKKDLIIDGTIMKSLDRITGVSVLRKHDVDKIFKLENPTPVAMGSHNHRVYMIMCDLISVKRVCDQVHADRSKDITYHLILVPRRLAAINQLIEEEGLWDTLKIYAFQWEPIQLDIGLLSLEMPSVFQTLFVDGDQTLLPAIARSLWSLQMLLGKAQASLALGRYSKQVQSMTELLMFQLGEPDRQHSDIGCLILIDRDVDFAATLLTPATYTSLIDEVLGIKSGVVELPKNETKQPVGHLLSSEDEIYNQIKNRHFSDVFSFLSLKAKQLSSDHERSQKMAVHEMKQYVSSQLKTAMANKRALAMHIDCCEAVITSIGSRFESLQDIERNMLEGVNRRSVISYIEENLATGESGKLSVLRLMCLLSLTQDGLSFEDAWSLKTQFLHAYGYQLLPGLSNLESMGLLSTINTSIGSGIVGSAVGDATGRLANKVAQVVSLPKRSSFQVLRQKLKLFSPNSENLNLKQPTDLSYVFGGAYIPLACQLVHLLLKREISFEDMVNQLLPGSSVLPPKASVDFSPRSFLVYFIGGVTYAEVAAFQLLEKLTGTRIIVAGTSMVKGSTLINSAL